MALPGGPYDELPDGVLVAGPDGRVVLLNRAGARLLGRDQATAVGQDYRQVLPLLDPTGHDWWACTEPYRGLPSRSGQPERLLELTGGPLLLVTARYVRDRAGGPVQRLVVAFRDNRVRDRADRDRSDLISAVAHEIRSPLTTVKGFTATLLSKWDRLNDDQKRMMLLAVNTDADRVNRLLSDLLDASRIDAGRFRLRTQVVDLPTAVERVLAGRVAAGDDPDRFTLAVTGPLPETWLDPDRVAQVFGNLVENAVRHGAGLIDVTLEPALTADRSPAVLATVTDQGRGIPSEIRHRVFAPFWRGGHATGHTAGTGLGLYVVRGIMAAHGGSIEVDGAPGGGALFRVLFPAGSPPYLD